MRFNREEIAKNAICCSGFLGLDGFLGGADVVVGDLLDAQAGKLLGECLAVPEIKIQDFFLNKAYLPEITSTMMPYNPRNSS